MTLTLFNEDNAGIPEAMEKGVRQDVALDLVDKSARYCRMPLNLQSKRFEELRTSIASQGQITPVILRPSPTTPGRFETVDGHRRIAAIDSLGKGSVVRAIIADLDDLQALLVGSMDNTTSQPLSYAEKVWHTITLDNFASTIQGNQDRLALDALSLRAGELSRFRDIRRTVSIQILEAIGPAYTIGKDLWWSFTLKIAEDRLTHLENLRTEFASPDFQKMQTDDRFQRARAIVGVGKLQHRSITVDGQDSLLGKITERSGFTSINVANRTIAEIFQELMPLAREFEANPKLRAFMKDVIADGLASFATIEAAVQQHETLSKQNGPAKKLN